MTIAFDSANDNVSFTGVQTVAMNIGAGSHRIVTAAATWEVSVGYGYTLTFGGMAMTQYGYVDFFNAGVIFRSAAAYILAPPLGAQNLVLTLGGARTCFLGGVSYNGVDQASPWYAPALTTWCVGACTPSIAVPSQANDLVVDFLGLGSVGAGAGATVGAGQTERNRINAGVGGGSAGGGQSDEPGALTTTMSWAGTSAGGVYSLIAGSLRPHVDPRGRAVKYFFNIWDPTHTIKDGIGNITPNEVRADNWIETDGFTLGESTTYPDFIKDPTKSRIVSITYRRSGVDIKTSKSQFADVIVARAAAGRM